MTVGSWSDIGETLEHHSPLQMGPGAVIRRLAPGRVQDSGASAYGCIATS